MFFDTEPDEQPVAVPSDPALDEAMKSLPKDPAEMLKEIQGIPEKKEEK